MITLTDTGDTITEPDLEALLGGGDAGPIHCWPTYRGRRVRPRATTLPSGILVWRWPAERRAQLLTGADVEWDGRHWSFPLERLIYLHANTPLTITGRLRALQ